MNKLEGFLGLLIQWKTYSKTCLKWPLSKRPKIVFKTNYPLMQVKSIAECWEHSAILSIFIKLPFGIKIFVLSVFSLSIHLDVSSIP